jgi:hypothetical protein
MIMNNNIDSLTAEQIAAMDIEQLIQLTEEANLDSTQEVETNGVKESEAAPDLTPTNETAPQAELDESQAKGVFSKNGEHILPFDVVTSAREEARTAKQEALSLQAEKEAAATRIAELEAQLKATGDVKAEVDQGDFYDAEDLERLSEDLPEVAEKIKRLQDLALMQATKIKTQENVYQQSVEQQRNAELRDALDANPLLATLEADKNAEGWNRAAIIDQTLRNDPNFSNLPVKDRLAIVAERYAAAYGVPESLKGSKEYQVDKVKQAMQKANVESSLPKSISDLQGGMIPSNDPLGDFLNKSYEEIEAEILKMPPDKQVQMLAKISAINN